MKLNKLFFGLLGIAAFTLSACSDDDDYTPARVTGQQVYFSNEAGETFEIDLNASVTNMPIYRISTSEAYTTDLKVTLPEGSKFTIPSQVSFNAGDSVAYIPISYNPAAIVRGEYEDVTIQIVDSVNASPWGISSYSFKLGATAWSDWMKWNANGTATYTYVNYYSGDAPDLTFLYRQDASDPNHYQFKLENWGSGVDFLFDYDKSTGIVSVPIQYAATNSTYGSVSVTDYFNYWTTIRGYSNEEIAADGIFGSFDEENGYIYIPLCWYVSAGSFGYDYETITIGGYDRKDLSAEIVYSGKYIDANEKYYIISNVTLGEDVSKAHVALVPGQPTEGILNQIVDKSYEPLVEITESGEVRFDANELEDGDYTLIVVPFLEKDAILEQASSATFTYSTGDKEKWNAIATGVYQYTVDDYSQSQGGGIYEGTLEATLYQSSKDATRYKIAPWAGETSDGLIFTLAEDGTIIVDGVDTGDSYGNYGEIYASDMVTAEIANIASSYNAETGVFTFNLAWQVDAGSLAFTCDTFTLTNNSAKARSINGIGSSKLIEGKKLLNVKHPKMRLKLK